MPKIPSQITDSFWSPRLETNARKAIYHQWQQLEASRCIDNFRLAAGEKEGFHQGWFFADSDAYKWLDAAARIYASQPDLKLASYMDSFIVLLAHAQKPDGYLFTYNQLLFPGMRWVALQVEHELYCHGHLIEAGVSHVQATGKTTLLDVAVKAADLLVRDFKGAGPQATPGHQEIEIALLRLYQVTGRDDYLDLARQFLEQRGRIPLFGLHLLKEFNLHNRRNQDAAALRQAYLSNHPQEAGFRIPAGNAAQKPPLITQRWYLNALRGFYAQQHAPLRRQTIPVGHSVRFGYLQTAAAMLQRLRPDPELLHALETSWERMVTRRMYVTGGLGSLPALEGFGRDYELDPEYAYAETCAALASLFWSWEMALTTGEAKYSDLFEWQLYNAAAVGMGLEGDTYLYNNPLACRGGVTRKAWYAVPCCPSNLSRTWADLGKYIASAGQDALWIHQYIGSEFTLSLGSEPSREVRIAIDSRLPWDGRVRVCLDPVESGQDASFALHLRLPSWRGPQTWVTLNGAAVELPPAPEGLEPTASGYDPRRARTLTLHRRWSKGDCVELDFDLQIHIHHAHTKVRGHAGKVAITRGPLVYCLESLDNPGLDIFTARIDPATLHFEFTPGLLGGIHILRGQTREGQPFTAIPYPLWANRGESQMTVWVSV